MSDPDASVPDAVREALRAIDGVDYLSVDPPGANDLRIVLEHRAPFEVVDEIRDTLPWGLLPVEWGATQEHRCSAECAWRDAE